MGSDPVRNPALENLTDRQPETREAQNEPESSQVVNPSDLIATNRSMTVSSDPRASYGQPSQLEGRVSPLGVRVKEPAPMSQISDDHVSRSSGGTSEYEDTRSQSHQGRASTDLINKRNDGSIAKKYSSDMMNQGEQTQDSHLKRGKKFGNFLGNTPRDSYSAKRVPMIDDSEK
jgi:hypothetical protein